MQNSNKKKPNRLINEKSPYLLQHSYNPVDWYPWGAEAFEIAKKLNKPTFLSIGYSTCHWCHVMAHESFEDEQVASLMNETFVNIKVDREERPDIDSIYMDVCQILTGSGGWPLTIIMTPEQKPFFAATYIPKESIYGRLGMIELIPKINELWKEQNDEILSSAEALTKKLSSINKQNRPSELLPEIIDNTYEGLLMSYDEKFGGFGNSPKFPVPHNLRFLLSYYLYKNNSQALKMIETTLLNMSYGGIYDHLGFGFHRYSTDRKWLVPHFEKMLYDQAHLMTNYLNFYKISNKEYYKKISDNIFDYLKRVMLSEDNAFYSAEDADSEGKEGKFYLWTYEEIKNNLSNEDFILFKEYYNIKSKSNFSNEISDENFRENILHITETLESVCEKVNFTLEKAEQSLNNSKSILFNIREKRIHPHKDDKILCDWNSMIISALAKSYQITQNQEHLNLAKSTISFIEKIFIQENFKLLHRYKNGKSEIVATADDYAYLIRAYLDLYAVTFNIHYLKQAYNLQEHFIKHFWDDESFGFYMAADYSENLIVRKKDFYDGAIPSSNSIAFENLFDLWEYTSNIEFRNYANSLTKAFANYVNQMPTGYTYFVNAYLKSLMNMAEIVIITNKIDDANEYIKYINSKNLNGNFYTIIKTAENENELSEIANFTKDYSMIDNKATTYICSNFNCSLPINTYEKFKESIDSLFK